MTTILKARWSILCEMHLYIENNVIVALKRLFTREQCEDYETRNKIEFDKYTVFKSNIIDTKTREIVKSFPGEIIDVIDNAFIIYYVRHLDAKTVAYIDMNTLAEYPEDIYLRDVKMFTVRYIEQRPIHRYQVLKYYSETRPEHLPSITLKAQHYLHDNVITIDNYLIICSYGESTIIEITPGLTHYLTHIKYKHPEHDYFHVFKMNVKSVTKPALSFL